MGKKDEGTQGQFWNAAEDTPLFCGTPARADDPGRFEPEPSARQARLFGRDTVEELAEGQRQAQERTRRMDGQETPEDAGPGPLFDGQEADAGEETPGDAETPEESAERLANANAAFVDALAAVGERGYTFHKPPEDAPGAADLAGTWEPVTLAGDLFFKRVGATGNVYKTPTDFRVFFRATDWRPAMTDAETLDLFVVEDADPVYVCPQCLEPMDGACQCPPCAECEEMPLDCNCPGLTPVTFQELQEGDRIRRVQGDGPIWIVQCTIDADERQPYEIGIADGEIDNFQSWEWIFAPDAGQWERV